MPRTQGVEIIIHAFLPVGKSIDEQADALNKVKTAHAAGDYTEVLKASTILKVRSNMTTKNLDSKEAAEPVKPAPEPEAATGNADAAPPVPSLARARTAGGKAA